MGDDQYPRTVDIEVARRRAAVQPPTGTVLLHPGGPGLPASQMLIDGLDLGGRIADSFDQVAWTARGVAGGDELACSGAELDYARSDHARAAADDTVDRLAVCATGAADLVASLGAASQILDIDAILGALGSAPSPPPPGSPLHLVGFSYGTYVMAAYAAARPERVTSMVLDGYVAWHDGYRQSILHQADAVQSLVSHTFGDCDECAPDTLEPALAAARGGELRTGSVTVQAGDVIHAVFSALYGDFDPASTSRLFDPSADARYLYRAANSYREGLIYASTILTSCAELGPDPRMEAAAASAGEAGRTWEAAVLGEYRVCDQLELPRAGGSEHQSPITAPTMIVSSNDAITPFDPATVGGHFTLATVTSTGRRGHTSWSFSACVRDAAAAFFIAEAQPPSTCEVDR